MNCEGWIHRAGFPIGLDCDQFCWVKVFPDELGCWSNAECDPGHSCQGITDPAATDLTTVCALGGGPVTDNTGESCHQDGDCYSLWCHDYPSYCAGVCLTDEDCPTLAMGQACNTDQDCPRGYRCNQGNCERRFVCTTQVVDLTLSASGEMIVDWINLCAPVRRQCQTSVDCPAELDCKLIADPTAEGGFVRACGREIGDGPVGVDCDDALWDGCATGICVTEGNYCSIFCNSDQDCVDPEGTYSCRMAPVEVWPGYSLPAQVCARR
jgi:hypothetical protein